MKLKITILMLLHFVLSYSQNNTISVTYKCKIIEKKESKLRKMMLDAYPNIENNTEKIEFILNINDNKSSFSVLNNKIFESKELEASLLILGFLGNVWTDKDYVYEQQPENYVYKTCIVKSEVPKNWELINETKNIDNYKCYKAVYKKEIINPRGVFYENITAWYCPELPYSFGPLGLCGLPGLILEAQTKNAVYGLYMLNTDQNSQMIIKPKLEELTTKEYFTITKAKMDEFFKEK